MGLDTFPSNNFHWKLGPHMLFIKSWVQIFHNLHLYKMTEIIVSVWASVHRGMCVCVQVLFLKRRHMSPKHQLRHKRGKVQKNRALSAFRCIFSLQLFWIQNYSVAFLVFFHFAQQKTTTIWRCLFWDKRVYGLMKGCSHHNDNDDDHYHHQGCDHHDDDDNCVAGLVVQP